MIDELGFLFALESLYVIINQQCQIGRSCGCIFVLHATSSLFIFNYMINWKVVKLKFLYWLYYKMGLKNPSSAIELLQSDLDVMAQYSRLVQTFKLTGLCNRYLKSVSESYLIAVIVRSAELILGKTLRIVDLSREDLKQIIELVVGPVSIYNNAVYVRSKDEIIDFDEDGVDKIEDYTHMLFSMAKLMVCELLFTKRNDL